MHGEAEHSLVPLGADFWITNREFDVGNAIQARHHRQTKVTSDDASVGQIVVS
jgi:hypothetical protein